MPGPGYNIHPLQALKSIEAEFAIFRDQVLEFFFGANTDAEAFDTAAIHLSGKTIQDHLASILVASKKPEVSPFGQRIGGVTLGVTPAEGARAMKEESFLDANDDAEGPFTPPAVQAPPPDTPPTSAKPTTPSPASAPAPAPKK